MEVPRDLHLSDCSSQVPCVTTYGGIFKPWPDTGFNLRRAIVAQACLTFRDNTLRSTLAAYMSKHKRVEAGPSTVYRTCITM